MEENNRKGAGIFYAVVGVATLVVAIIGATFAYFSASASNTGDEITGGTNDDLASALSISAKEVTWTNTGVNSHDLVPATFGDKSDGVLTKSEIQGAINAKCVNNGYTGCHLWKIEANTTQTVANASVLLSLKVDTNSQDPDTKKNWRYAIFTANNFSEGNVNITPEVNDLISINEAQGSLEVSIEELDIHNNAAMTAGTIKTAPSNTYYLLVYLNNMEGHAQNEAGNSETGTYTGTVTMNAAGGQVSATFTAAQ